MCSILSAVSRSFDESAVNLIQRRGPDGPGISTIATEHHLTGGHRRLAIFDLSPVGQQPMWTPDNQFKVPMLDIELIRFIVSQPASYRVGLRKGKLIQVCFVF